MSWEAIGALSAALTGVVIAITAVFGAIQLRQIRAQRRDFAAIELVRSIQDDAFSHGFRILLALPSGISGADLRACGPDHEDAAQLMAFRLEMIGWLVHRGTVSFTVVDELVGGGVVSMWDRIRGWANETREAQDYPMFLEWFQWLAEQLASRGRLLQTPAHIRNRQWRIPNQS
jgi:hypothetical protein